MSNKVKLISNEFRQDINGLRGLAVILVLLFHLEFALFEGGFLGVDVFFVISGYLISRNILRDLQYNQFSFKKFYTKRFKRLFPALFFTLGLSLLFGYWLLSPTNLERLGKSTLSGLFSVANLFFLSERGYFDVEAELKPLLHVWSLSLEEQFYLVWPFILFIIFKFSRAKLFLCLFILSLVSVVSSSIYNSILSSSVFYLLPFRMFEFILGALVIWLEKYKLKNQNLIELVLIAGLGLIIYSSISFNESTPMPGFFSLVPCFGTMLIIFGGNIARSSIILKNKIFAIIGKSSYSIYLVHWPLIVFYKYYTMADLTSTTKVLIAATSLIVGYLMWKYIENTFRYKNIFIKKTDYIWYAMPVSMTLLSFLAINILNNKGYPSRYPAVLHLSTEEMLDEKKNYWSDVKSHTIVTGENEKKIIVMGNSHAVDLIYALKNNSLQADIIFLPTTNHCYNFGTALKKAKVDKCDFRRNKNLKNKNWSTVNAIYLHDNWRKKDFQNLKEILSQIRALSKAPVFVFGPKMTFTKSMNDIVFSCKSSSTNAINKYAQKFAKINDRSTLNDSLIDFFTNTYNPEDSIFYIDVLGVQSNDNQQFEVISSKSSDFLYFDRGHFTEKGSTEFGVKLKKLYPHLFDLPLINN